MHVIVGQGQLDAVLSARPEDRRAFVEEAAGVLKHRKRREKTVRKLDAMQANLNRLTDLTGEIRRQLGPLGRQAAVARRAAGVQADLRDARMRLLADDLAQITAKIAQEAVDEQAAIDHRTRVQDALADGDRRAGRRARPRLREATPALQQAQDTWFALSALAERMRGTIALAAERARNLAAPARDAGTGRDPDQLEAAAARAEAEQAALQEAVEAAADELAGASAERAECERGATCRRSGTGCREPADRRPPGGPGPARRPGAGGPVPASRPGTTRSPGWPVRSPRPGNARRRPMQAFATAQDSVGDLDSSEVGLDEAHEEAAAAAEAAVSPRRRS